MRVADEDDPVVLDLQVLQDLEQQLRPDDLIDVGRLAGVPLVHVPLGDPVDHVRGDGDEDDSGQDGGHVSLLVLKSLCFGRFGTLPHRLFTDSIISLIR